MTDVISKNDKVFVTGGRNEWGILRAVYSNCAEPWAKIYIIDIDDDINGEQIAYRREQFLTRDDLVVALTSIGCEVIWRSRE
jgi:hypothetical protein